MFHEVPGLFTRLCLKQENKKERKKKKQQANNETGFDPGKWNRHEETAPIRACLDQDGK